MHPKAIKPLYEFILKNLLNMPDSKHGEENLPADVQGFELVIKQHLKNEVAVNI